MSYVSYETKGKSELRGQVRIFCEIRREEYDRFYRDVRDDLFEAADCAVFSLNSYAPIEDMQLFRQELSKMDLIVIVVAQNTLKTEDPVLEACIGCAATFHIPVLPLVTKHAAEDISCMELYHRKFGYSQYLILASEDGGRFANQSGKEAAAAAYEEYIYRLKVYLDSTIASAELTDRIRKNFRSVIFISYRRKDQYLIPDLKNCIYSDPALADTACWYDEFLTPGENFNETIMTALERSDVFLLMITPAMLEDQNYVITTEYPAALELGKPVVSVEVEETNHRRLAEVFDADAADTIRLILTKKKDKAEKNAYLPDGVPDGTAGVLCARLKELLSDKLGQAGEPEYEYLLGMAYCYGVDVIRDSARAEQLLAKAAKAEYMPALRQLVKMNPEWYADLRDSLMKQYTAAPSPENALMVLEAGFEYARFRALCVSEPPMVKIRRFHDLIRFAEQYSGHRDIRRTILDSAVKAAELYIREGMADECAELCGKYFAMAEQDALAEDTPAISRLAGWYRTAGENALSCRDMDRAARYWQKAEETLGSIPGECREPRFRLEKGLTYLLGELIRIKSNTDRRTRFFSAFESAEKLGELLTASSDDYEYRLFVLKCKGMSLHYRSEYPGRTGTEEGRTNYFNREADVRFFQSQKNDFLKILTGIPGSGHPVECCNIHRLLGDKYMLILENDRAEEEYLEQYSSALQAVRDTQGSNESFRHLLDACSRLIRVSVAADDRGKEEEYAGRCLEAAALMIIRGKEAAAGMDLLSHLKDPERYISRAEGFDATPVLSYLADRDGYWYSRICDHYRVKYEKTKSGKDGMKLLEAAGKAARYRIIHRAKNTADVRGAYRDLLQAAKELRGTCGRKAEYLMVKARLGLVECDLRDGHLNQAYLACRAFLGGQSAKAPAGGEEDTAAWAWTGLLSGMIAMRRGNKEPLRSFCEAAIPALEALPGDTSAHGEGSEMEIEERRCLAAACLLRGDIAAAEGKMEEAAGYYTRACDAVRGQIIRYDREEDRLVMADAFIRRAMVGKDPDSRLEMCHFGQRAIINDAALPFLIRKTVITGLICEAHGEVHSILAFDLRIANMVAFAEWLTGYTGGSFEARKLLYDAYATAVHYSELTRRDRSIFKYSEKQKKAGRKLAWQHPWMQSLREREGVRSYAAEMISFI